MYVTVPELASFALSVFEPGTGLRAGDSLRYVLVSHVNELDRELTRLGVERTAVSKSQRAAPLLGILIASASSTGMTTTANGVPASSLTCGSGLPKALPPTMAFS